MGSDLVEFVSSLQGGDGLRVEETLGNGFVRLRIAEAERRQAKHDIRCVEDAVIELLRNARDAGAQRIFVASWRVDSVRSVVVIDDGSGIPKDMHERVFDARVTSKLDTMHMDRWGVHGRGMALYSIAQNALEAHVVDSNTGMGACIGVSFDTSEIAERADQSTWPRMMGSGASAEVRGPHNIARTCVEFALEEQNVCAVYYGSASEILATMFARVRPRREYLGEDLLDCMSSIPLVERAALASDARHMRAVAQSMGMEMSERTAHRIVRGQIKPLRNVLSYATDNQAQESVHNMVLQERAVSLTNEDRQEFSDALAEAFGIVAERYYVVPVGEPRIRVGKGTIQVVFDYVDDD